MRAEDAEYDVAIVGASIAGCTAAVLFARRGARVALIEREKNLGAFKKVCTHYIQPSATPTIERLGLARLIEASGGVRNGADLWTRWGWIRQSDAERRYGYSIRREKLDPMLRDLAINASGVEFLPGYSVHALVTEDGRPRGVQTESVSSGQRTITARLVVGADGRNSRIAELANVPTKAKPHRRFAYFAHFRNLPLSSGSRSQMWFLEPDMAYAFPNDDGITLLAAMPGRDKIETWKSDTEGSMRQLFEALPGAPALATGTRVSPYIGMIEMPNITRRVASPGLALVGDAALAADPLWGVGCGWAFQSAEWLVDHVADSLGNVTELDRGLTQYRKRHRWELAGHEFLISDYATCRAFNPIEKLMYSAAARNAACADHLVAFGGRTIGVAAFLAPSAIARAARVNLAHYVSSTRSRAVAQQPN
jgi:flavin-dependent dehydrogenase